MSRRPVLGSRLHDQHFTLPALIVAATFAVSLAAGAIKGWLA